MTERPTAADFNRFFRGRTYGNYDIFTPHSYKEFIEANDIDLTAAINRYDGATLIGSLVYGIRDRRAWFGLIGVAHGVRRRGLGGELVDAAIDAVRTRGVNTVELEIVQRNQAARDMVFARGFEQREELLVWSRGENSSKARRPRGTRYTLDIIRGLRRRPAPCWQREPESIHRIGPLLCLRGRGHHALIRARADGAMVADADAVDLAAAHALLDEIDARVSAAVTLNNEPAGSPISRACAERGWRIAERQHRIAVAWPD
jgi:GNAT superfamily N-acetyltransferase